MRRAPGLAVAFTLVAVATAGVSTGARAEESALGREKAMCASKYQSAQRLRAGGKLTVARADLLRCAEPACPAFVSKDCKTWLAEVESELPTVVFAVLDANGGDVPDAIVRIDGAEVPRATDGLGHALDPGAHVVEASAQGQAVREQVIARVGERSRRVLLRLPIGPTSLSAAATSPGVDDEARAKGGAPAAAYALGGVGALAIVAGTVLWVTGSNAARAYNDDCASRGCSATQRDDAHRQLVAGDIAWGVGLAAGLGAVAVVLLRGGKGGGGAPSVSLGATGVRIGGRF